MIQTNGEHSPITTRNTEVPQGDVSYLISGEVEDVARRVKEAVEPEEDGEGRQS